MCLIVKKTEEFNTSNKPIKCYKLLYRNKKNESLCTPFRYTPIVSSTEPFVAESPMVERKHYAGDIEEINEGIIHCFSDINDNLIYGYNSLLMYTKPFGFDDKYNVLVYECEIPPNTPYIYSVDRKTVGAQKIRFIRELTEEEYAALR